MKLQGDNVTMMKEKSIHTPRTAEKIYTNTKLKENTLQTSHLLPLMKKIIDIESTLRA